jgi:hypothetical protein
VTISVAFPFYLQIVTETACSGFSCCWRPDVGALHSHRQRELCARNLKEKDMGITAVKRVGTQWLLMATLLAVVRPAHAE